MLYNRPPVSVYRPSIYQIFAEQVNLELEKESAKKMQTCCFFFGEDEACRSVWNKECLLNIPSSESPA